MKSLIELTQNRQVKDIFKHPRHRFIDFIYQRVNHDRVQAGYKPLSKRVYAIKTAHLSLDDLGYLCKRMGDSVVPGKVFFGSLKIK